MSSAKVQIADVVVPSVFENYVIERTAELTRFYDSGVLQTDPEFDALAGQAGATVNMPFWQDLTGDRQLLSDAADMVTKKITTSTDIAKIHNDGDAWSVNILAKLLAGEDPMMAIGDLVAQYWARQDEAMLISMLKGIFLALDAETNDPNYLKIATETEANITSATSLNGSTFVDALQKLGDRNERLTALGIHSGTEAMIKKLDLIDYIPDSEGKSSIATFQGRRVIVDDGMPVRNGTTSGTNTVFTSVLFGDGAVAKGAARLDTPVQGGFGTEGVEFARSALGSDTHLINRRRFILHVRGVKWAGASMAGQSPTNAELALAANWTRVYEAKNVRVVGILHNNGI